MWNAVAMDTMYVLHGWYTHTLLEIMRVQYYT